MLEEDELLPAEEDFFRDRYPQFRSLLLRKNFSERDVREFQARLYGFSRLINPTLSEMERICRMEELLLGKKNAVGCAAAYIGDGTGGIFSGFSFGRKSPKRPEKTDNINNELFDLVFRYCVCWQNLVDTLKNHARELYQIYHGFFEKGLINKYSRFYNDVKTAEPEIADRFITEFLKTEIRAYETEFESLVDPVNPDPENPGDAPTLRDICRRVEVFFESGTDRKFY
jgi:hypothetical protein